MWFRMPYWKEFLKGAGRVIDICPSNRRWEAAAPFSSDAEAIAHDWYNVGLDLWSAMKHEQTEQKTPGETRVSEESKA